MTSRLAIVKKITRFRLIFFPVFFALMGWVFIARLYHPPLQTRTQLLMDTYWTINIPGGPKMIPVIDKVFVRLKEIDSTFDISNKDGQIYGFNYLNKSITDPDIIAVIKQAKEANISTHGAFDITVGPLLVAFEFFSKQYRVPPQAEIDELLKHVGLKFLDIQTDHVTKTDPKAGIDLGGIAKVYAISEALRIIKESGVKNALIDGGGDIYALGLYEGRPWKVGVRHPRKATLLGKFAVSNMAVFSSGDYERYFIAKGVRYHHIFNPKIGYPARGLMGSTIICSNLDKAGGLSSSLFVMGPDKALSFINAIPGVAAILVDEKQNVLYSKEFCKRYRFL